MIDVFVVCVVQLLEALQKDCDMSISKLWVDGGMTRNKLLLQMLADLCGITIGKTCIAQWISQRDLCHTDRGGASFSLDHI